MENKETYLGDGVYASFDGFQIWLRVELDDGIRAIALEPQTFDALLQFAGPIWYKEKMN